ncbi:hypothetical protein QLQ12_20155 [Actinoplanes sp. NEAU-A12]|uniref:Uncharacterized protein n=1 Tax=Actinoplanes sandaracinus TaxID=3045177 RepID=A0ABT6WMG1_9ACTN|nr:hypothetical protein [Actinoplanes sandaracinus]MDI6100931.1 hypothetical protein [Actinoplanes sandaracinus]
MRETVTYLEKTNRGQLIPADPVRDLALESLARSSPLVVELRSRIGVTGNASRTGPAAGCQPRWCAEGPDVRELDPLEVHQVRRDLDDAARREKSLDPVEAEALTQRDDVERGLVAAARIRLIEQPDGEKAQPAQQAIMLSR